MKSFGFGATVRAYRHRWGSLPDNCRGLMRISVVGPLFLCELRPLGLVPNEHRANEQEFVLWWEKGHGRELVESSPVLRAIKEVKAPFSVVLDENGVEVQS